MPFTDFHFLLHFLRYLRTKTPCILFYNEIQLSDVITWETLIKITTKSQNIGWKLYIANVLICDMVRSRRFENLYHTHSELENIKTDFTLVVTSCNLTIDMHIQDGGERAFSHANISKSREDNEDLQKAFVTDFQRSFE